MWRESCYVLMFVRFCYPGQIWLSMWKWIYTWRLWVDDTSSRRPLWWCWNPKETKHSKWFCISSSLSLPPPSLPWTRLGGYAAVLCVELCITDKFIATSFITMFSFYRVMKEFTWTSLTSTLMFLVRTSSWNSLLIRASVWELSMWS